MYMQKCIFLNLINLAICLLSDNYLSILHEITFNIYDVIFGKDSVLKAISKIRNLKYLNAHLFSKQVKSNSAIAYPVNKGFNDHVYDNQPCHQHVRGSCSGSPLMS